MEPQNNPNRTVRNVVLFLLVPVIVILLFSFMWGGNVFSGGDERPYSDYYLLFKDNKVESCKLDLGSGKVQILLREEYREDINKDGKSDKNDIIVYSVPDINLFLTDIDPYRVANGIEFDVEPASGVMSVIVSLLPALLMVGLLIFGWTMMRRSINSMGGGAMNFGKARVKHQQDDKRKTTFADVAGADEEKEELAEIVEFLKSPKKYKDLGARVPKGVLLMGPPGTGKTLLARAVAGEAGVPFFSISGSDFLEMYVGVGASRVRDLFDQAKKSAPCIIFIDEIDAVGRQRGTGLGGGHDEREQTLNQLLVEMDGFGMNEGVITIAATNRPDILDPALMRPGRFDRQVVVNYPDIKGREAILKVHAKGKPLAPDVDLSVIAKSTAGFTGADLENLLNEAALLAARKNYHSITMPEIEEATVKVVVGTEKRSHVISDYDKKITAYHEAGHAVVSYFCPTQDPVHLISIIPRGRAAGFTMNLPTQDKTHMSRKEMLEDITVLLAGRAAEALVLDDICTGASNDIERATEMARQMVTKYGMSEKLGPILYGSSAGNEVFLGRDFGHTRNYSEEIAAQIDAEINQIIQNCYKDTETLLTAHMDKLHKVAAFLIENEKMESDAFKQMMEETEKEQDAE